MNKKIYASLLLFLPVYLFAQSNFKAGVIVNLKGDTVRGLINYKEWLQNPTTIAFRSEATGDAKELGTEDIQFFRIDGYVYYRKYQVNISLNNTDVQQLSTVPDTSTKTATVFLKIIQSGKNVTLFSYTDELKTRFYILDNTESQPQELKYLLYLNSDNTESIVTRKIYQGQLSAIAASAHLNISSMIANARYVEPDLSAIVSKINGGANAIVTQNAERAFRFYAGLSGASSTLTFSSTSSNPLITGSSSAFVSQIAVGFDGFLNPNVGKVAIRAELSVSTASYSITDESTNSVGTVTKTSSQLKQFDIGLSPTLIYNVYNTKPLSVYISAGLKANIAVYPTNSYSVEINGNVANTGTSQNANVNSIDMESFYVSVPLQVGIILNKQVNIYAGYSLSSDIVNYELTSGKITALYAGINFFFGK
jgi:hypothetical protein